MNNLTIRDLMEMYPNDLDIPLVFDFNGYLEYCNKDNITVFENVIGENSTKPEKVIGLCLYI